MSQPPKIPGLVFVRPLGAGGYADVFLYQQQMPQRLVAVKVLKEQGLTEAIRAQFTAEANAMAGLADHPNIVPVFWADVAGDGRPYIVMMFYPRPNLGVRAAAERFAVAEVLRLGIQIGSAVETAHRAGILHRDIKPANILTSQYGAPGLTDFGIAAQAALVDEHDDTGVSVPWSPPEVLYASAPASIASDVYSLGATLWHLLVGRSPFEIADGDNSAFALMSRIRDVAPPTTGRPDVPDQLDRLLRQAMAKDPAARPATAMALARELQAIEQAQQLPRTEIVVLIEAADDAPSTAPNGTIADATRMRAAPRVAAQASVAAPPAPPAYSPPPPRVAPPPPAAAPATVARHAAVAAQPAAPARTSTPGPFGPPAESTVRRRAVDATPSPAGVPADGTDEPAGAGHRRAGLAVALACAAVVVAVVVLAVTGAFSGGGGSPKPDATVTHGGGPQDPGVQGQQLPPGPITVVGRRARDHQVTFHWTYSASRADDSYLWRRDGATTAAVVHKPALTLPDPGGKRVCIEVKVVRADGSNGSLAWSPAGCAP